MNELPKTKKKEKCGQVSSGVLRKGVNIREYRCWWEIDLRERVENVNNQKGSRNERNGGTKKAWKE